MKQSVFIESFHIATTVVPMQDNWQLFYFSAEYTQEKIVAIDIFRKYRYLVTFGETNELQTHANNALDIATAEFKLCE